MPPGFCFRTIWAWSMRRHKECCAKKWRATPRCWSVQGWPRGRDREFLRELLRPKEEVRHSRAIGFVPMEPASGGDDAPNANLPPLVLDADALNLLAGMDDWPSLLPPDTIVTPHPGEFARLAQTRAGRCPGQPAGTGPGQSRRMAVRGRAQGRVHGGRRTGWPRRDPAVRDGSTGPRRNRRRPGRDYHRTARPGFGALRSRCSGRMAARHGRDARGNTARHGSQRHGGRSLGDAARGGCPGRTRAGVIDALIPYRNATRRPVGAAV